MNNVILYPQLHDLEWMRAVLKVPAKRVAAQVGCRVGYVQQRRKEMGLQNGGHSQAWTEWEDDLLVALYRRVPTQWLREELSRGYWALYKRVAFKGLQGRSGKRQVPIERNRGMFWRRWREAIRQLAPMWTERGDLPNVEHLTWRPARRIAPSGCYRCRRYGYCVAHPRGVFACERVSVGELLGWMNGGGESSDRTRAG